ncbi:MAG: hypothetical protein NC548_10810 [Lachnospiraceae bacterium]|nr:hypothetical protein [Lachnospiraceae bacterium]
MTKKERSLLHAAITSCYAIDKGKVLSEMQLILSDKSVGNDAVVSQICKRLYTLTGHNVSDDLPVSSNQDKPAAEHTEIFKEFAALIEDKYGLDILEHLGDALTVRQLSFICQRLTRITSIPIAMIKAMLTGLWRIPVLYAVLDGHPVLSVNLLDRIHPGVSSYAAYYMANLPYAPMKTKFLNDTIWQYVDAIDPTTEYIIRQTGHKGYIVSTGGVSGLQELLGVESPDEIKRSAMLYANTHSINVPESVIEFSAKMYVSMECMLDTVYNYTPGERDFYQIWTEIQKEVKNT